MRKGRYLSTFFASMMYILAGRLDAICAEGPHSLVQQIEKQILLKSSPERTIDATGPTSYSKPLETIDVSQRQVSQLIFSHDSKRLASRMSGGRFILLWDVETGKLIETLKTSIGFSVMAFSATGDVLFTGHVNGTIALWNAKNGKFVEMWQPTRMRGAFITGMATSADGNSLVSSSNWMTLWNLETKKGHDIDLDISGDDLRHVAFGPDSQRILTGFRRLILWDRVTGKTLVEAKGNGHVFALAFAPNGKMFATCSGSPPFTTRRDGGVVQIWDPTSGVQIGIASGFARLVNSVCFSPDSEYLLAGAMSAESGGTVHIWNLKTGKMTQIDVYEEGGTVLAVSPNAQWLATAIPGLAALPSVRLYKLAPLLSDR